MGAAARLMREGRGLHNKTHIERELFLEALILYGTVLLLLFVVFYLLQQLSFFFLRRLKKCQTIKKC